VTPFVQDTDFTLYVGDVRDVLRELPAESVHCVVTSPPYFSLRDYGVTGQIGLERTLDEYVAEMVGVFQEVRRVMRYDATLWLNLGDAFGDKQLLGAPWRVAFALQADGWYLRSDIIWAKPNPMPESVTDRPTKAHEYLFLLTKAPRYYFDADAIREPYFGYNAGGFRNGDHDPYVHGRSFDNTNAGRGPDGRRKTTVVGP
jgi:DNA modification methylase